MGPFLEKERLLFYFFPGKSRVVLAVTDSLRGERLQARVDVPKDGLAQWTRGHGAGMASPPNSSPGDPAQGQKVAVSACLSRLSICLVMLRAGGGGALSEGT